MVGVSAFLNDCLQAYLKNRRPNFTKISVRCCLWPWHGLPPVALRYGTHFPLRMTPRLCIINGDSNEAHTQCDSMNQSISRFLQWPKWCNHCKDHQPDDVSRCCRHMTARIRNVLTVDGRWTASLPQRHQLAVYSRCVQSAATDLRRLRFLFVHETFPVLAFAFADEVLSQTTVFLLSFS